MSLPLDYQLIGRKEHNGDGMWWYGTFARLQVLRLFNWLFWLTTRQESETEIFWDPVITRCSKRLAMWKANYLSFGGRITLIKLTTFPFTSYRYLEPLKEWWKNSNCCKEIFSGKEEKPRNSIWFGGITFVNIYIYIYIWWFRMGVELQTETKLYWLNGTGYSQKSNTLSWLLLFTANFNPRLRLWGSNQNLPSLNCSPWKGISSCLK